MRSICGHRIDYNGLGVLRGQQHIPSKNLYSKYPSSLPPPKKNNHAGEKGTHWDRTNKDLTPFEIVCSFVCLCSPQCTPWRLLRTQESPNTLQLYMVVLYHMNDLTTGKGLWCQVCSAYRWCSNGSVSISNWSYTCKSILMWSCLILSLRFWGTGIAYGLSRENVQCILLLISKWRHMLCHEKLRYSSSWIQTHNLL